MVGQSAQKLLAGAFLSVCHQVSWGGVTCVGPRTLGSMMLCEQRKEAERNQQEKGTLGLLKGAGPRCPGPADFFPKELWDGGPIEQYKLGENWLIQQSLACSSGIDSRSPAAWAR